MEKSDEQNIAVANDEALEAWVKPAITSFAPVKAAEGISYRPSDGLSNLS